ncbi:conserved hypothetical protein [Ixodes scapularis]|uniref:GSKIP domain-containing protein n=1 Tax=Ixodes scapularis TaxID=6945 RepID=B7Q414_IXOSC|nr:conserved hypothetical protein [Ixodes scapularis]|eukprot:XP_002411444.1 conserved hypothetical protein [Ixodes scapularis]
MSRDDCSYKYGIEEKPFQDELKPILDEIRFGVTDVQLSTLSTSHLASYFNLETKEGRRMCIMMSRQGFQVVGSDYDCRDIDNGETFETINALLDSFSPAYRRLFSEALAAKLEKLKQNQ